MIRFLALPKTKKTDRKRSVLKIYFLVFTLRLLLFQFQERAV